MTAFNTTTLAAQQGWLMLQFMKVELHTGLKIALNLCKPTIVHGLTLTCNTLGRHNAG
jgi:hypothetical protein